MYQHLWGTILKPSPALKTPLLLEPFLKVTSIMPQSWPALNVSQNLQKDENTSTRPKSSEQPRQMPLKPRLQHRRDLSPKESAPARPQGSPAHHCKWQRRRLRITLPASGRARIALRRRVSSKRRIAPRCVAIKSIVKVDAAANAIGVISAGD